METLNLKQGSDEWKAVRAEHKTASEAPAMMGESKYQSRDDLMEVKKSGVHPEVNAATQRIFDNGHKYEALARPLAEEIIGEELFPATGTAEIEGLKLLASFDGTTMMNNIIWEHKSLNDTLREYLANKTLLPLMYRIQMEQQLMISGAEKCLFMASDGTKENMLHTWYMPDPELRAKIIAGWKQFESDMIDFIPAEKTTAAVGKTIEALPALTMNASGSLGTTNIDVYKEKAIAFVANINTELETDQDFADAESMVKFCDQAEKQIKAVKQSAISQMTDINEAFDTIDFIVGELSRSRLMLDKLVKNEKANKKNSIINKAKTDRDEFIASVNKDLGGIYIQLIDAQFGEAAKGKRTLDSIQSAVNDLMASEKIRINDMAMVVRANLKVLETEASEHKFLFNDLSAIIHKDTEDFILLVKSRVKDHVDAEADKLEQKRIADEKQAEIDAQKPEQDIEQATEESKAIEPATDVKPERTSSSAVSPAVQQKSNDDRSTIDQAKANSANAVMAVITEYTETLDCLDEFSQKDCTIAVMKAICEGKIPNIKFDIY